MLVEKAIVEAGGIPVGGETRRRLFIVTTSASEGWPAITEAENGLVCVIALDDMVDVVVEMGPTLGEVMKVGVDPSATDRISCRIAATANISNGRT